MSGWSAGIAGKSGKAEAPSIGDKPRAKKTAPSVAYDAQVVARSKYALAALQKASENVSDACPGTRNGVLNAEAYSLGGLIATGELDEGEVQRKLEEASTWETGQCSAKDSKKIADAIAVGKRFPRTVPAPNVQHVGHEPPPDPHADAPDVPPGEAMSPIGNTGTKKPSPFALIQPADIWAPLEEPKYLADGIIRRGSLTEVVAYGGSGKTWITVDLSTSVGAGVPWLGKFATERGRVAYLDYENGSYEMRRRLQAVTTARGLPVPIDGVELCCVPNIYMNDPAFGAQVTALAKDRALIVVDTLKAANPGVDENDSNMRVGLDGMRRAAELTGCAFVVLVHSKKVTGSVTNIDPREAGRGSSAIYDAADTVLHVQYTKGEPLHVVQTKSRLGRTADPFLVHIDDENGGVRVWAEAQTEKAPDDDFDALCTTVLQVVKDNSGASGRRIREKVRAQPGRVLAALEELEEHGAIRNTGTVKKAKWFPILRGAAAE